MSGVAEAAAEEEEEEEEEEGGFALVFSASHVHHLRPAWATSSFTCIYMHIGMHYSLISTQKGDVYLKSASFHPPPRDWSKRTSKTTTGATAPSLPSLLFLKTNPSPNVPHQRDARTRQRWRSRSPCTALRSTCCFSFLTSFSCCFCLLVACVCMCGEECGGVS